MSILTFTLVVAGFATFMTIVIAALPSTETYPLPDWVATAVAQAVGYINDLYALFPHFVTAIFTVVVVVFVAELLTFGWHAIRWIIRLVRGARV